MFGPKELAAVLGRNMASSDITLDEIKEIVRLYVRLHNRLYEKRWDERHYLQSCIEHLMQIKR